MFATLKWYNFETKKRFYRKGVVSLAMKHEIDTEAEGAHVTKAALRQISGSFYLMFPQLILFTVRL